MSDAITSWYVVIHRHGKLHGHVGPFKGEAEAQLCAMAWRDSKHRAQVGTEPIGPCLTIAQESEGDGG